MSSYSGLGSALDPAAGPVCAEFLASAGGFVCYERLPYYLLAQRHGVASYPLLYLDRGIGFEYGTADEPLLAAPNGLAVLMREKLTTRRLATRSDLHEVLLPILEAGTPVACDMWFTHTDGSAYATAALLEDVTPSGGVRYTKISDSVVDVRRELPWDVFLDRVDFEDGVTTPLLEYHTLEPLLELNRRSLVEGYVYVFTELFGYGVEGSRIVTPSGGTASTGDAFDILLDDHERSREDIISGEPLTKLAQVRLFKHIHNRYAPTQMMLGLLLDDVEASAAMGEGVAEQTRLARRSMDDALRDLQKWANFLVARPSDRSLDRYLQSLRATKGAADQYSRLLVALSHTLIPEHAP